MKKQRSIAVLGCGPMGLLVAHAVIQAGHRPYVYSIKKKSVIPGSQHLHGPIPGGVTPLYPEGTIQFVRLGTAAGYAEKVYGDKGRETGWDNYLQVYPSWNVIKAYNTLWGWYEDLITDLDIRSIDKTSLFNQYDLVISTLPAGILCYDPSHRFNGVSYYIKPLPTPPEDARHEIVVYNGLLSDPWYRWSILGGQTSIEATHDIWMGDPTVITGTKAVDHTCDCWPEVVRCGRWAEWRHGITMHRSYLRAEMILDGLL